MAIYEGAFNIIPWLHSHLTSVQNNHQILIAQCFKDQLLVQSCLRLQKSKSINCLSINASLIMSAPAAAQRNNEGLFTCCDLSPQEPSNYYSSMFQRSIIASLILSPPQED